MWRCITYLFPVLINMILGGMFFITSRRFSEAEYSKIIVTCTMAMWAIIYSFGSLFMGKITTAKRAPYMLIVAGLGMALSSLGFIVFPNLKLQYLWIGLYGVFSAGYCTPFQEFAKELESGKKGGVVRSTALYTMAWSLGMALGPSLFGVLPTWQAVFYVNAVMSMVMVLGVPYILWKKKHSKRQEVTESAVGQSGELERQPNLALMGWIGTAFGTLTIAVVRTLEPALTVDLHIGQFHSGFILALVSYMQAAVAILVISKRRWMYSWKPLVFSVACGIVSLLLLAKVSSVPLLYLSTFLYGIYSAVFYFIAVYFSQAHPTKSAQYIAINEAVVGVVSVLGSVSCGVLSQALGMRMTFAAYTVLMLVSLLAQLIVRRMELRRS